MTKHALVVDDDPLVRGSVVEILSKSFHVTEAESVDQALEEIRSSTMLDFLVTDLNLDDSRRRTGLDIAVAFRTRYSHQRLLVMSGEVLDAQILKYLQDTLGGDFLAKPFRVEALLDLIGHSKDGKALE